MSRLRFKIAGLPLLVASTCAFAFGPPGHEEIGAIADKILAQDNPKVYKKIQATLGTTLEQAAVWMDCAKNVQISKGAFKYVKSPKYPSPECKPFETEEGKRHFEDYVERNWDGCDEKKECHKDYHYTDISIQHTDYNSNYVGAHQYDILNAVNAAVAKLRRQSVNEPFSIKTKQEAVLMLAHFVGDIHQPLHVGSVYLDKNGTVVNGLLNGEYDPSTFTQGGNLIRVNASGKLHAEWDHIPPNLKANTTQNIIAAAVDVPPTKGDVGGWAQSWAEETLGVSAKVFAWMNFVGIENNKDFKWQANFEDRKKYLVMYKQVEQEQIVKAGARLAAMLTELYK
ncbi:S1/P1 nuclease [Undibacterium terreum]|uniref:Endonuclease n=1 Tax=Undibacterium terreum TaxID=1224302 RepID=A0A916XPP5_9BURK|nr:S1/P1 nuclease [Undibacterium terreum]GGC93591.1 endonuclease [Undibacterium terreum]